MKKWRRFLYQPGLPLGADGRRVTGSQAHIDLSRQAASESMVLLKNDHHTLPFAQGKKVALFGKGTIDYVKGGGGSGDVTVSYTRNLYEGMCEKEKEEKVHIFKPLCEYYQKEVEKQYQEGYAPGMTMEPELPDELLRQARHYTDTAVISICRFSGEGWDRIASTRTNTAMSEDELKQAARQAELYPEGDFYLSPQEQSMVKKVKMAFDHVVIVLNTGGIMDTTWFKSDDAIAATLLAWQGGMEGGLATADILCGDVNPSAKLTDTFASRLEDYPSTEHFHESDQYVEYNEDIYMGYRYFETIPGAYDKVNYEFGFGLSYTEFDFRVVQTELIENQIQIRVEVTNVGDYTGREVLQLYVKAPEGKLGKPAKQLVAFAKTRELAVGETQMVNLICHINDLASYDDQGLVCQSAWVMEAGSYRFFVGNSVRNVIPLTYTCQLMDDEIVKRLSEHLKPYKLHQRMRSDGTYEQLQVTDYPVHESAIGRMPFDTLEGVAPENRFVERRYIFGDKEEQNMTLEQVYHGEVTLDEFMEQMSLDEMIFLLGGQSGTGVANTYGIGNLERLGIPDVMTSDGPAGVRILPECGVYTTAWPCSTMLACSFDEELVKQVGMAAADELKENNMGIWLAPAVNLHRSPLCGRNFEYYSEDPYVAGKIGAAMVQGIQSRGMAATVKHFACNNKETYRKDSDSIVSERAARELYLKSFERIVEEADPWCIMTSYNIVNGVQASENKELITDILRGEWNYQGIVMSDWWTHGEHYLEVKAGNDVKMANGYPERVMEAFEAGAISEQEIHACAKRVLEMILKLEGD